MDRQTLLIADSNEDFRRELSLALAPHFQVLDCETGMEALRLLRHFQPDVLVLDIMLPELDGFTLLEWVAADGICPKVLAFLPLTSDYEQATALRLGIGYMMRKPCPIRAVVARVLDLNTALKPARTVDPTQWVKETLAAFPLNTTYKGYPCVETAIVLFEQNPEQSFTNELYVEAAKRCRCSKGTVERNTRTLLEAAWKHGDPAVWQKYFPGVKERPEVSEFIRRMAESLHKALE